MKRLGDFTIVRELGRGGMGVVYEAIEQPLDRKVALKLLHPEWAAQEDISARFADEARKIAKLSHPSIVRVHRFGKHKGKFYLALEYVDGLPLDNALARERWPLEKTLDVLIGVAEALGHAHT